MVNATTIVTTSATDTTNDALMNLGGVKTGATSETDIGQKEAEVEMNMEVVRTEAGIEIGTEREIDVEAVTAGTGVEKAVIEAVIVGGRGIGIQIPQSNTISHTETAFSS